MADVELEITALPCGAGCGRTFQVGGLVDPRDIQREAFSRGWGAAEVDGNVVVACRRCKTHSATLTDSGISIRPIAADGLED